MKIERVGHSTTQLVEAFARLLPQLSSSAEVPTKGYVAQMIENPYTHLLVAEEDGVIVGTLSLVVVEIPTGRKAWIEDVITDSAFRGRGIGQALVERAKSIAEELGAEKLLLTSNPSRRAATVYMNDVASRDTIRGYFV